MAPPPLQLGHTVNIRHADISPLPSQSPSRVEEGWGGRLDGGTSIVLQEQEEATGASSEALWLRDSQAERQEEQPASVNTLRLHQASAHMMTGSHIMLSGWPRPPAIRYHSRECLT